jgi:hypothetical protein
VKRFIVSFLAAGLLPLLAQTSSLQGLLTDQQGSAIPDAVVTLTNLGTSAARKAVAGQNGIYSFLQVPPGRYQVEAQSPGFRTMLKQITLQVDTPATLNFDLEVGQVTETVNVVESVTSVNTQNATVGINFNETQVRQLPLLTRNVVELLSLQPGVTPNGEVLGAKRDQNNVTLDGVDVNDQQRAGINTASSFGNGSQANGGAAGSGDTGLNAALPVPLDSVQEFRVTVTGQGAEQGRSAGGQVSLVTKSGSNQWHGSLYNFHRNTATAANDWFNNRSNVAREALIRNQYGASFGGRIIRDRVFFFANWEDRKDRSASAQSRQVPTESLKQGIVTFRQNDGTIGTLSPAEVAQVDPLRLGFSPTMQQILNAYPTGNDPVAGSDRGLNFIGLRFNAPLTRNDRAYVSKFDFNIDKSARHVVMWRGTLADNKRDQVLAQFPGQDAAAKQVDNSRGMATRYTAVLSPNLINVASYGYTRLGIAQAGTPGTALSFDGIAAPQNFGAAARSFGRIIPTHNIANDLTWNKGRHVVTGGINFRLIANDRNSFVTAYPSYSFSRNTLLGLGSDMTASVNGYIRQRSGNSTLAITEPQNVQRALGILYGLINQYSATYNFNRDGSAVPFEQPVARSFATNEYDFYFQDQWRVRPDLTLTYGVRYQNFTPPYERNGIQVVPTTGLDVFFAERIGASQAGIPGGAMPNAALTFDLAGPVNGKPGWFRRDNNNWAPRFALAYAPTGDSLMTRMLGSGSVFRAGAAMVYDRYGSDMVVQFDQTGSPGLASQVTQPRNTDFTTSFRYAGGGLPPLPAAPNASFPFTPPTILGGFNSNTGVFPDLVAPYSYLLNATFTRPLPGGLSVEAGYLGRLSRKQLLQSDVFQPLTEFRDPRSGQTWAEAAGILRDYYEAGLNAGQVPNVPFFENMFGKAAGLYIPGTATQNYFHTTYNLYGGSDLDALNDMDRERLADGSCVAITGCNTFFALQNAGMIAWRNAGSASFHGGQLTIRRPVMQGWGFDFNYTLSHSIDLSSGIEAGAGSSGAVIQNSFDPRAFRGSSDFDIRHNISANSVYELPFGKGKAFGSGVPGWANQVIGGWQVSGLMRYRSGLPTTITNAGVYPTNYLNSAIAILRPGATLPANGNGFNQNGNPSIFRETAGAMSSFMGQYPGRVGQRGIIRTNGMFNVDLAVAKAFFLPWEGHRIQFRAEAFNAFNNVNFFNPSLRLDRPSTFGEFQNVMPPRVLQFALRYEF